MKIKCCSKCGNEKPLTEFYKRSIFKDDLSYRCKDCIRAYNRHYQAKHKEKIIAQKGHYYRDHKKAISAQQRRYREDHEEEIAAQRRQYREENKKKIAIANRRYYEENKDEILAKNKSWAEEHKEEVAIYKKQWEEENQERLRVKRAHYYEEHQERIIAKVKRWHNENPGKVREQKMRRRAREVGAEGSYTEAEFVALCECAQWVCPSCGFSCTRKEMSIDHVIPLSKGGSNAISNIQPLCRTCNIHKGVKVEPEWDFRQYYIEV